MAESRISAAEAFALMRDEGYMYLDVRTPEEFAIGHPTGSVNIPWEVEGDGGRVVNPDFLGDVKKQFATVAKVIVGCNTANRSKLAAAAMREAGYRDVREQRGGMAGVRDAFGGEVEPGWEPSGLPVSR